MSLYMNSFPGEATSRSRKSHLNRLLVARRIPLQSRPEPGVVGQELQDGDFMLAILGEARKIL